MGSFGYLQITRQCNQCCRICSNPENENTLTLKQGKKFIDSLIADGNCEGVIITGGEPTMSEDLPEYLKHCAENKFRSVLITNGQRLADSSFVRKLKGSGLSKIVMSLYSADPKIQTYLTGNPDSLANFNKAARNIEKIGGIDISVTMTINKCNASHLSMNVEYIRKNIPSVNHVVFNNLDPLMNRASLNPDTIPMLNDIDIELTRSVELLRKWNMTYRIERVPLCYMAGFEHNSTETRKIVKKEKVRILFLDEKEEVDQAEGDIFYGKAECCRPCYMNDICIGLYSMDVHYMSKELFPVFHIEKEEVIEKVLSNAP
jgi:MoaA/NifB/PqqE/SkfB family radical SAM enzyme